MLCNETCSECGVTDCVGLCVCVVSEYCAAKSEVDRLKQQQEELRAKRDVSHVYVCMCMCMCICVSWDVPLSIEILVHSISQQIQLK